MDDLQRRAMFRRGIYLVLVPVPILYVAVAMLAVCPSGYVPAPTLPIIDGLCCLAELVGLFMFISCLPKPADWRTIIAIPGTLAAGGLAFFFGLLLPPK
jgi:hypothetical protein